MTRFETQIAKLIWDQKYRYRIDDKVIDSTIMHTFERIAKAVASCESGQRRKQVEQDFLSILDQFQFIPGGRIFANAGTHYERTLFNCFVMGEIKDDLNGIFDSIKEGALTLQQGGGVGYDFSSLRPSGVVTQTHGGIASGPVSFMDVWDQMSATIQSTGDRRGAMMGTLRCDHPDILEFVQAKSRGNRLTHFNISVLISDAFMIAVEENEDWPLRFPESGECVRSNTSTTFVE